MGVLQRLKAGDGVSARPRILVLITEVFADGGIQRFNRTFLSACDRLGVECEVLSLADAKDARGSWMVPPLVTVRGFGRNKLRFALAACAALFRGGFRYVIIGHVNLLELVAVNFAVRPRGRTQALLIAHGIEVWTGMAVRRRRRALEEVDLILSVSRYTRERIHSQVPEFPEDRITVFPNALSETWTERYSAVAPGESRIQRGPFLLSVTRLDRGDRYKGIVTVIEALAMLEDAGVHYVVAGRGDDREFLEQVAARCGVQDRVHFLGVVSDAELVSLYGSCAAFILPSGKEGFGIVFLEAMYFGAPVIAAREKGAVDVVQHESTGLLVAYGDTIALKDTIERLLGDPALQDRLRANGRATVAGSGAFTFQAYVGRLATVFGVPSDTVAHPAPQLLADNPGSGP